MIQDLRQRIETSGPLRQLLQALDAIRPGHRVDAGGVAGSLGALVTGLLLHQHSRPVLAILPQPHLAEQFRDDIGLIDPTLTVQLFGAHTGSDISAIRSLATGETSVTIVPVASLLTPLPLPARVKAQSVTVTLGSEVSFGGLRSTLREYGFEEKDFVEGSGDMAVRGGILDVFPFVGEYPVRLEFLDDTLESIREFDSLSQRSIRELSIAVIVPNILAGAGEEISHRSSLLDYVSPETLVIVSDPDQVSAAYHGAILKADPRSGLPEGLEPLLAQFPVLSLFPAARSHAPVNFEASPQPSFNSSIAHLRTSLAGLQASGNAIALACDNAAEAARLKDLLGTLQEELGETTFDSGTVRFIHPGPHEGFSYPPGGVVLFTEHQIFGRLKRRGGRKHAPKFKGISEREVAQLRKGDYVVHQDYGIGSFAGLKRIRVAKSEQEVVKVEYAEKDVLYVNLNYVARLQKYSSKEGHVPKLTRLGSPEWDRLKSRTKKRVKEIARELIRLYAQRKLRPGHAFKDDTPWQQELEASFMYEDTFDQAKATREVKQDMESAAPMDRLICGDVGFGKTEVAVRAAFKAVMDGRQTAVLVPTTILAMQHFNTFLDRVGRYGMQVRVLSRFKARRDQQAILAGLRDGTVDIVIGTHRLLSKDVGFKNLGLLIIDEEHRFGVAAKEKLRQLRAEVDTLSLTATPIPRTLHFSLMGARDLSIIATPPRNRLPIVTELTRWKSELIQEAVLRELQRGGQVYFVHDRIETMGEVTARLRELLPGIRIASAHGQMHAQELETVMLDFLERRIDVLVATKIIESGLDIPNVNTIIINRADRFGMAELYQLRGRVGRSNSQAYAYLLTPPPSVMPAATIKRLQALEEFNELGSGFNLAMRDLEIRGAGNLLGAEQSGFIESLGFETYTRILEEAVQELRAEEFRELPAESRHAGKPLYDTVVEPSFDALIPPEYVHSEVERMALYRRLYTLTTQAQLDEIAAEMRDRFGKFPRPLDNLFGAVRVRLLAAKIGFRKVRISEDLLEADFPPESEERFYADERFQTLMQTISRFRTRGVVLRQEGTTLRLVATLESSRGPEPHQQAFDLLQRLSGT